MAEKESSSDAAQRAVCERLSGPSLFWVKMEQEEFQDQVSPYLAFEGAVAALITAANAAIISGNGDRLRDVRPLLIAAAAECAQIARFPPPFANPQLTLEFHQRLQGTFRTI